MKLYYCKQCRQRGHVKWVWGGTHWTHRRYMAWVLKRKAKQFEKAYAAERALLEKEEY